MMLHKHVALSSLALSALKYAKISGGFFLENNSQENKKCLPPALNSFAMKTFFS